MWSPSAIAEKRSVIAPRSPASSGITGCIAAEVGADDGRIDEVWRIDDERLAVRDFEAAVSSASRS